MAITKFHVDGNDYYRITKTWDHKQTAIQKYVKIRKTKKQQIEDYKLAQTINDKLTLQQQACTHRQKLTGEIYFRPNGQIVGISRLYGKTSKNSPAYEHVFKLRYNPRNGLPIKFTTVNINTHGLNTAWEISVDIYCHWAKIDNKSPVKRLILESIKYYQFDPSLITNFNKIDNQPILTKRLKVEFNKPKTDLGRKTINDFEDFISDELEKFTQQGDAIPNF